MVLAVYMPPQAPSPGQIAALDGVDVLAGHQSAGASADRLERVDDRDLALAAVGELGHPRQDGARIEEHRGQVQSGGGHQHSGQDLSHPANSTEPSRRSACITVSTLSAITSRDTSEKCMPS